MAVPWSVGLQRPAQPLTWVDAGVKRSALNGYLTSDGDSFHFSEPASTASSWWAQHQHSGWRMSQTVAIPPWHQASEGAGGSLKLRGARACCAGISAGLLGCCMEIERWVETHSSALFLGLFQTLLGTSELPQFTGCRLCLTFFTKYPDGRKMPSGLQFSTTSTFFFCCLQGETFPGLLTYLYTDFSTHM